MSKQITFGKVGEMVEDASKKYNKRPSAVPAVYCSPPEGRVHCYMDNMASQQLKRIVFIRRYKKVVGMLNGKEDTRKWMKHVQATLDKALPMKVRVEMVAFEEDCQEYDPYWGTIPGPKAVVHIYRDETETDCADKRYERSAQ